MPSARGTYLLKFGEKHYLRRMYEHGALRVSTAARYLETSFNDAIRDDEREFTQESISTVTPITSRGRVLRPEERTAIPLIGPLKITRSYTSDCYLYCMSEAYEYRLFDDFGYDACIVVHDLVRFMHALKTQGEEMLSGWTLFAGRVTYRDPCAPTEDIDVLYTKHFRFKYQQEYRFAWEPPSARDELLPLDFNIGPMVDYSTFLEL